MDMRKQHSPEQIINKLREAGDSAEATFPSRRREVELSKGSTVGMACKKIGVTDHTYYRWRSRYGGMRVDGAKRLKELERENGYLESFNGKLRDELLNVEIFDTLLEAQVLLERWRRQYNTIRPHSSLSYRPPAPEALLTHPLEPTQHHFLTTKTYVC